jgi:hypothetical protein
VPFQTATQYKDGRLAPVSLSRLTAIVQWLPRPAARVAVLIRRDYRTSTPLDASYIPTMQRKRKPRPGRDKLVGVKITPGTVGNGAVIEHCRDEDGDRFFGRPLGIDKRPPASSVKRSRKASVPA